MYEAELLTRLEKELGNRKIRASLAEFARLCGFHPAKHHLKLIEALEAVARGDIPSLAVFMPPGSAKSTYASILFPAWLLGQLQPNILACSHTTELAERFG